MQKCVSLSSQSNQRAKPRITQGILADLGYAAAGLRFHRRTRKVLIDETNRSEINKNRGLAMNDHVIAHHSRYLFPRLAILIKPELPEGIAK